MVAMVYISKCTEGYFAVISGSWYIRYGGSIPYILRDVYIIHDICECYFVQGMNLYPFCFHDKGEQGIIYVHQAKSC